MKSQYETFLDGQKKIIDYWKKTSVDFGKSLGTTMDSKPEDFLKSWIGKSEELWKDAMEMGSLEKVFKNQPDQIKEYIKKQQKLVDEWNAYYKEAFDKFDPKKTVNPFDWNAKENFFNPFQTTQDWMKKGSEWVEKELLNKTPFVQQYHYKEFLSVFEKMHNFWNPLLKMVEFDMNEWDQIKNFIDQDKYKDLVANFMGYKYVGNQDNFMKEVSKAFEKSLSWFDNDDLFGNQWSEQFASFNSAIEGDDSPFKYIYGLNKYLNDTMGNALNIGGQGKEIDALKKVKDLQYSYLTYLTKNFEMQQKVYESSLSALPETIEHFAGKYQDDQTLPEYKEFFNHFVNILEKYVTEVLNSKEYSVLQSAVAKSAVNTKKQMEKLIESSASGLPFLTNSFADEIAAENKSLKDKIRSLEKRLNLLEKAAKTKPIPVKSRVTPAVNVKPARSKKTKGKSTPVATVSNGTGAIGKNK